MNGWYTLAERQYGVISRSQLRAAGLTDRKIDIALGADRIERLYAGVFRVQGSYRSARQRAMAAVLWCGADALLSHETGGSLLRLPVPPSELVHVSVTGNRRRTAVDVVVHRTDTLEARDRVIVDGLPCTSATRTVIDLASVLQGEEFEHLFETARRYGLTTRRVLGQRCEELCGRGRVGSGALKALLKAADDRPKESKLEVKTARLLASHGLRPEATQYRVASYRLDHAWPSVMFARGGAGRTPCVRSAQWGPPVGGAGKCAHCSGFDAARLRSSRRPSPSGDCRSQPSRRRTPRH